MKIYTRTGDEGTTGLIGGKRIEKHALRLDAYGTVDELNATLGLAAVAALASMRATLAGQQHVLFNLGAYLALDTDAPANVSMPPLTEVLVERLEREIDEAEGQLPPLTQFVLPGGCEASARLHLARTVCRRAERVVTNLASSESVAELIPRYLNRLSDWLFVHARLANHLEGHPDVPWDKQAAEGKSPLFDE
ncbi:MAG: cob(I)yrinic acid a,c-diamide adenosyltransferase [Planctomycetota bacterium]